MSKQGFITNFICVPALALCGCPEEQNLTRWDWLERDRQACTRIGGRFSFKSNPWTSGFDTACATKESTP